MSFLGGIGNALFGKAPSTTTIPGWATIGPASEGEKALYDALYYNAEGGLKYANDLSDKRQGMLDTTMGNMGDYQKQLANMQYNGELNPKMAGQLEGMYNNQISNINNYANEGVGGVVNNMANRGVLNSSATGGMLAGMARNVDTMKNDAYNNYMNNYMNTYNNQYANDYNALMAQAKMNQGNYGFLESAYNNAYKDPYNLWSKERSDRYGLENDVYQTPGTPGLLQTAAQGAGMALPMIMMT